MEMRPPSLLPRILVSCRHASSCRRKLEHPGINQPHEIFPRESDQLAVSAGVKAISLSLARLSSAKTLHSVEISKGRHCPGFAAEELIFEFCFAGESNRLCSCSSLNRERSTWSEAEEQSLREHHQVFTITVFASSFPDSEVSAAIP